MAPDSTTVGVVERIRRGERSAESELFDRFYRPVFSMVLARTGKPEVAEDLAQEILVSVICALRDGKLENRDGLVGYICGTMRNRVKRYFRSQHLDAVGELRREPVLGELDPEEEYQFAERRALADEAIAHLSEADQEILRLTLVEGLTPREICARLGLESDVVRQRKSRAMRRAREYLRGKLSQKGTQGYSQAE